MSEDNLILLPENRWNPFNNRNWWTAGLGGAIAGSPLGLKGIIGGFGLGTAGAFMVDTNADRNRWAMEVADRIPASDRQKFLDSITSGMNRDQIYSQARTASSAGREADRQQNWENQMLQFQQNQAIADRQHELRILDSQGQLMNAQMQSDATMRGIQSGMEVGLGLRGLQSNETIAQGQNQTQFNIAGLNYDLGLQGLGSNERIAEIHALNNIDVVDAQGGWNTINTGMQVGGNVEMNRENARTSRYNTGRNARAQERVTAMDTAIRAADTANRQINYWSQFAR